MQRVLPASVKEFRVKVVTDEREQCFSVSEEILHHVSKNAGGGGTHVDVAGEDLIEASRYCGATVLPERFRWYREVERDVGGFAERAVDLQTRTQGVDTPIFVVILQKGWMEDS